MKARLWVSLLLIGALLALAGCGGAKPATGTNTDASNPDAAATGTAGGSGRSATAPAEKIVLKFSHVTGPTTPKGKAAQLFADKVAERLGDRVVVEVYPAAELFDDGAEMEALKEGKVDFIAPAAGKLPTPEWQIFDIPFLVNVDRLEDGIKGDMGKMLAASAEPLGLKVIGLWTAGARQFTNSKHPLHTPADFAGLKFRIQKSPVLAAAFDLLQAQTQAMPLSQVRAAMAAGEVDGGENSFSNIYTQKMHEVQKYLTVSNHGVLAYPVLVNTQKWSQLPADIRATLEEIMLEVSRTNRQEANAVENGFYEKIQESGMVEVVVLTPEERQALAEAMRPLYTQWEQQVGPQLIVAAQQGA